MIGSGDLGMGVTVYLEDDFTNTAKAVAGEMDTLEGRFAAAAQGIDQGLSQIQTGIGGVFAAAAIAAPLGFAVMKSAELSDALADVTKTTGIAGDKLQFLRGQIEDFDTRTSVEGLLEMAKAGGSMGVAAGDIAGFTNSVDKLNVALGDQFASPEVLARDLTKLRNVLKDIKTDDVGGDLLHIGNALNYMGANAAATEGDIADVAGRMAGLGMSLGMSSGDIFGMATALLEMGVSAEVAGTNLPLIMQRMAKDTDEFAKIAGISGAEFKKMVNEDIVGALVAVAQGSKNLGTDATDMAQILDDMGLPGARVSEVFLKLADNTDIVGKRIGEANLALTNTDSVMGEFAAKNETLAAVLDKAGKAAGILTTRIGDALAPAVEVVAGMFTGMLKVLAQFVSHPIGKWIVGISAALVGLGAVAMATTSIVVSIIPGFKLLAVATWTALAPILPFIAAGAAIIGLGVGLYKMLNSSSEGMVKFGLAAAYVMGPIGWIVGGIMTMKRGWEDFSALMDGGEVKTGIFGFFQKLGGVMQGAIEIWQSWNGETFQLSQGMHDALEKIGILDFMLNLGTWIVRVKEFAKGLLAGFASIGTVASNAFGKVWGALEPLIDVVGELVGMFFNFDGEIGKNASSLESWYTVGKLVADFLMTGFKIAIEVVSFALQTVIYGITNIVKAFIWLGRSIKGLFSGELSFADVGRSMVEGIAEGIVGAWDMLVDLFTGLVAALPFGKELTEFFGGGTGTDPQKLQVDGNKTPDALREVNEQTARNAALSSSQEPVVFDKTSTQVEQITNVVNLDGEQIYNSVKKREQNDAARQ